MVPRWSRVAVALGVWLLLAGCAASGAPLARSDQNGPVHGESGGGSGGSM